MSCFSSGSTDSSTGTSHITKRLLLLFKLDMLLDLFTTHWLDRCRDCPQHILSVKNIILDFVESSARIKKKATLKLHSVTYTVTRYTASVEYPHTIVQVHFQPHFYLNVCCRQQPNWYIYITKSLMNIHNFLAVICLFFFKMCPRM